MDNLSINLAYKYVALAAMLTLANDFAQKAELRTDQPFTLESVQAGSHVSPPRLMGFGGSVVTTNYFFGFNNGYLANFKKVEPNLNSDAAQEARNKQLATMNTEVNADGAYQLATNWLTQAGIDISGLESKFGHKTTQRSFLKRDRADASLTTVSNEVVSLPVFDIEWGNKELRSQSATYSIPLLVVTVFGHTKELVRMHITDDGVVGGAKQPVKDVEKLLALSDAIFLQYDEAQRSNLVSAHVTTGRPLNSTNNPQ